MSQLRGNAPFNVIEGGKGTRSSGSLEPPGGGPGGPGDDAVAALRKRVDAMAAEVGGMRNAVDGLKTAFDGFKDSLRTMQWAITAVLGVGVFALGILVTVGIGRLTEINGRLDRFLERQAESAAAANSRFDRLFEQRAVAPPAAPVIIQMPGQPTPPGR